METAKDRQKDWGKAIGGNIYIAIGVQILRKFFEYAFSIPFPSAISLAMLTMSLTSYPLFIHGSVNRRSKNKAPWKFSSWAAASLIMAILVFFAANPFFG